MVWAMWVGVLSGLLAGCGSGIAPQGMTGSGGGTTGTSGGSGAAFSGAVMGAGRPVAGAAVMLYGAGSTGNGMGATALLSESVTTGADGSFAVPGKYRCASGSEEVYVVARGGTVGTGTAANGMLAEMTLLGTCGAVSGTARYAVNEATTVAAVWAMRPFLAADGTIGATASNGVGIENAGAMAQALVSVTTGTAPGSGVGATVTVPVAKLNTLASLLAVCAADAGSAGCGTVLGGAADTLAAAVGMAGAPGSGVAARFGVLAGVTPVFLPVLAAAPPDWTVAMTYAGGGLIAPTSVGVSGPTAVAVDAEGRGWVANYGGVLSVFGPTGTPVFAAGLSGGGMGDSYGLSIDPAGRAWVTNTDAGTVTVWNGAGTVVSGGSGFGAGDHPVGVAIAADGTVWIADNGNATVQKLRGTGESLGVFGASGLAFPQALAVDGAGGVWVGNGTGSMLTHLGPGGATLAGVSCCDGVAGVAVDAGGNVWAANYFGSSVSRVSAAGVVDAAGPYRATGLSGPQGIAVDGAGAVWVASLRAAGVTEFAGSSASVPGAVVSPAGGWATDAGLNQATGLAIDASGDVWVSNFAAGTVTEVVGVATPVKTPLVGLAAAP